MTHHGRRSWRGSSLAVASLTGSVVFLLAVLAERSTRGGAVRTLPDSDFAALPPPASSVGFLVGTNYTHHSFEGCDWAGTGLLLAYHQPGVAATVRRQLGAMRDAGIGSLRLLLWHMHDVRTRRWGVVPSAGGRLIEPYRGNLTRYLEEVRRSGFGRLTISFAPQWSNNPLRAVWDPAMYRENRDFIADVRALAERHGPADVRYDLMNEGAPSDYLEGAIQRRTSGYLQRLYADYVDAFGAEDVTVSVIAPARPEDRGNRLGNLIDLLERSGAPLPSWFEVHVNAPPRGVAHGLRHADSVLTALGLGQPLTIGETSYDDAAVAAVVQEHLDQSDRPLEEILQWYRRVGATCEESPPFRADAYRRLEPDPREAAHRPSVPATAGAPRASRSR